MSADNAPPEAAGTVPAAPAYRLPEDRWHAAESVFWLIPVLAFFFVPGYLVLVSQIRGQWVVLNRIRGEPS